MCMDDRSDMFFCQKVNFALMVIILGFVSRSLIRLQSIGS